MLSHIRPTCIYTVSRKKHPLTFLIITPSLLGRFLYFFVPMETGMNALGLQFTYLMP